VIFGDQLLPKVLDGSKTVTRRPVKYDRVTLVGLPGPVSVERPCKYKVGTAYGVQPVIKDGPGKGRGGKAVGRIRILDVRREQLKDVGFVPTAEARREGFKDWGAFATYWEQLYGSYDPTQLVDRIEFELVADSRTGS
jgi:hypothetical protein